MSLRVEGEVERPRTFGFEDLSHLPGQVEDVGALVPGKVGAAVPLKALLEEVNPKEGARFITLEAEGGSFSASVPLPALQEGLLAYRLGAEPLPASKGGPLRFYLPNAESCGEGIDQCVNVKFLERIVLSETQGRDTRPSTRRAHEALHKKPGHEHLK